MSITSSSSSSHSTSRIMCHTLSHSWSISNFHLYHEFNVTGRKYDNNFINTFCRSATFGNEHLQFYLKLYPIIKRDFDQKFVSLFLYNVSCSTKEIVVRFKMSLINEQGELCNTKWADWIIDMLSSESRYGFDEFISYAELLDPAKGNLPGGNLTVFCEISYLTDETLLSSEPPTHSVLGQLTADLEELYNSGQQTDVTLIVDDHKLKAHKVLLCARSTVFAEMFRKSEKQSTVFEIEDVSVAVMEKMLRFLYCGKINIADDREQVLAVAEKFNITTLKSLCANHQVSLPKTEITSTRQQFLTKVELHYTPKLEDLSLEN